MLVTEPDELAPEKKAGKEIPGSQLVTVRFVPNSRSVNNVVLGRYENMVAVKVNELCQQHPGIDDTHDCDSLSVLFCPVTTASTEWKNWLTQEDNSSQLSSSIIGGRITINSTRAVYCGALEHFDYALKAIAQFSLVELELVRLESTTSAALTTSEDDVNLTHQVNKSQFSQGPHVNKMTALIARELIAFTRLDRYIMQLGISSFDEHRILVQLVKAGAFEERMMYLDNVIEVVADIYELANDRLSECTYFHKEYEIEVWIVIILVAELLLLVVDIIIHYG